jgi:acetoacetyl-CoA synthetase
MKTLEPECGGHLEDYESLYDLSIASPHVFWSKLWDFLALRGDKGTVVVDDIHRLPGARWFPEARLNFAENLLRRNDDSDALIFRSETGARRTLSWRELHAQVASCSRALESAGVKEGDRVAGYLPNLPEAVVAMLATTAIGAIWCACSPDYGVVSCLDRLRQVEPKVLFTCNCYVYGGRTYDLMEKVAQLQASLPSLECVVTVDYPGTWQETDVAVSYDAFLAGHSTRAQWRRFPFDHPALILFSSGTTGMPKCIVHGAGGSLLQTLKEVALHSDVNATDRVLYLTTTGWMVWNVMASALGTGASLVLYDGSATHPSPSALWDVVDEEDVSVLRIVPKLLELYENAGLVPSSTHRLGRLKCIQAGSAPLSKRQYEYVYTHVKRDVHLMSPAGGTDIMGTFATGSPISSVWPGEIQVRSLGMKVEIYDDFGRSVIGQPGELVCTQAFPTVPVAFWNDDGTLRHAAYFEHIPGIWRQGDWARITCHGGVVIDGRSDATLNVNGVRIGTSEIYRSLQIIGVIVDAAAVECPSPDGPAIALFVTLTRGTELNCALREDIRQAIRTRATARHVPSHIFLVSDLPRSSNGKVSELAIRNVLAGNKPPPRDGLLNPEALEQLAEARSILCGLQ